MAGDATRGTVRNRRRTGRPSPTVGTTAWHQLAWRGRCSRQVRYLMANERARFPDDILWRRSKLGLTMPPRDREALAAFMAASLSVRAAYARPRLPPGSPTARPPTRAHVS